jgi:Ni,Fe-hydrogenase III large subunit
VTRQAATDLGLTGVVARASGVALDLRHALPARCTPGSRSHSRQQTSGDCWARMAQRMREAKPARSGCCAADRPALDLSDTPAPYQRALSRPCLDHGKPTPCAPSLVEGVRGPVLVALETDATGQLVHAKVQDPSLANWFGLAWRCATSPFQTFPSATRALISRTAATTCNPSPHHVPDHRRSQSPGYASTLPTCARPAGRLSRQAGDCRNCLPPAAGLCRRSAPPRP